LSGTSDDLFDTKFRLIITDHEGKFSMHTYISELYYHYNFILHK